MKYLVIIICLLFVQLSSNVYAQEEGKSVYLKQGTPAPFNGILLDSISQAKMIADSEYKKKKCELDCEYSLLKMRVEKDLEIAKLKVDIDISNQKYNTITKIKDDEIKRANEIAIKESNKSSNYLWWMAGGATIGVVTSIAIFFAASYGQK